MPDYVHRHTLYFLPLGREKTVHSVE